MTEEKVEKKSNLIWFFLVGLVMLAIGVSLGIRIVGFITIDTGDLTEAEMFILNINKLAADNQGEQLDKFMDTYDRLGYRTYKESGYILIDGEKVDREWMYIKIVVDIDEGVILPDVFHNRYFPAQKVSTPVI